MSNSERVTVLQSFPVPRVTTNPYIVMLDQTLRSSAGIEVLNFSWRRALSSPYDVFHAHWPEILVRGTSPAKQLAKQFLFLLLLLRLRLRRTAVVRTMHNLKLPSDVSPIERVLLRALDRATTARIRLNASTDAPADEPGAVIVHGHYREWFKPYAKYPPVPGRLAFVGLIRHYKSVDALISAFQEVGSADLSLHISGAPTSPELAHGLRQQAQGDEHRIAFNFGFLSEEDFVRAVTEASLVVLPYREMHNSGSVLAALSLNRPVLVPDNEVNKALSAEVGAGWVLRYEGELRGEHILAALNEAEGRTSDEPDLSQRDWRHTGDKHLATYHQALQTVGASPRSSGMSHRV